MRKMPRTKRAQTLQELKDLVHVYKGRAQCTDGRLRRHEATVVSLEMQNASLALQLQVC